MIPIMDERMKRGVKMRFLIPEKRLTASFSSTTVKNVEGIGLSDLPAIVVLTEKVAGVCLRQIGGRVDYAGFFGADPTFHNWVRDLFLYYWEKGKRF